MADKIKGAVFSMLENIMDRLEHEEYGRVLDLYAGSGSIGIEALSRGATWADFVETNAGVCRVISDNLEHTKMTGRSRVNNRTVQSFLNNPPTAPGSAGSKRAAGGLHRRKGGERRDQKYDFLAEVPLEAAVVEAPSEEKNEAEAIHKEFQYDIIFLDPPYADPKIPATLEHVARSGLAKPDGLVVIGHSPRVVLKPSYGEDTEAGKRLNLLRYRRHGDSAFSIFLAGDPARYGFGPDIEEDNSADSETQPLDIESEDLELEQ